MLIYVIIFITAFFVRCLNLYFHQLDIETYITEDQFLYWDWSLKKAYTEYSLLDNKLLSERMPGSFLFFQFVIWLVGANLSKVLLFQIAIDSINCVIIASIAKTIDKRLLFFGSVAAIFSPLLIIVSSQILSDTIFLFFFSLYIYFILNFGLNKKISFFYTAGLFLSLSLFTRTVALPLVFITLLYGVYIFYYNRLNALKIIKIIFIFFLISISSVTPRVFSNFNNYNTFSLTSQAGSHLAYWVVPAVLDFESNERKKNYHNRIQKLNESLEEERNPFESSALLKKEAFSTLFLSEKKSIIFAWVKGAIINIFSPSVILDNRIRNIPHPSFYENNRSLLKWLEEIFNNKKYSNYKIALTISSISTIIFSILITIGIITSCKKHSKEIVMLLIILCYFIFVTGPVFSPKYIHPALPVLIILEAIGLIRIYQFFVKFFKNT